MNERCMFRSKFNGQWCDWNEINTPTMLVSIFNCNWSNIVVSKDGELEHEYKRIEQSHCPNGLEGFATPTLLDELMKRMG